MFKWNNKALEENIREYPQNLDVGKDFFKRDKAEESWEKEKVFLSWKKVFAIYIWQRTHKTTEKSPVNQKDKIPIHKKIDKNSNSISQMRIPKSWYTYKMSLKFINHQRKAN